MQKSVVILLLFTFLFYIIGYKMLFMGLQYNADLKMGKRLEESAYQKDQSITLKIPISLPYQIHQSGFRKASGKFEYNGEYFNLVEQKIEGDTLYAVCIKDAFKTALSEKMSNFEKAVHNWPNTSDKAHSLISTLIKDYLPTHSIQARGSMGWILSFDYQAIHSKLFGRTIALESPPPELI